MRTTVWNFSVKVRRLTFPHWFLYPYQEDSESGQVKSKSRLVPFGIWIELSLLVNRKPQIIVLVRGSWCD
jgi:hypothetical protein